MRRKRRQPKPTLSPLIMAITRENYAQKFTLLKQQAEQHCLASEDTEMIAGTSGFLLFVTLRALHLDQYEIEDLDVLEALARMGNVLRDVYELGGITDQQRQRLVHGMDYLDALVQVLSKESVAVAWCQVDTAATQGQISTHDLDRLLERLKD